MRTWPVLLVLLAGCAATEPAADAMEEPGPDPTEVAEAVAVYIVATDMSYRPQSVWQFYPEAAAAPAGQPVNLTLKSAGGNSYPHTLVIEELDVRLGADAEFASQSIEIVAQPGTYTFYCDVEQHRLLGMEGTLTFS